jgi:hypothetical protein
MRWKELLADRSLAKHYRASRDRNTCDRQRRDDCKLPRLPRRTTALPPTSTLCYPFARKMSIEYMQYYDPSF